MGWGWALIMPLSQMLAEFAGGAGVEPVPTVLVDLAAETAKPE